MGADWVVKMDIVGEVAKAGGRPTTDMNMSIGIVKEDILGHLIDYILSVLKEIATTNMMVL